MEELFQSRDQAILAAQQNSQTASLWNTHQHVNAQKQMLIQCKKFDI